jgi:hypothetical protein
MSAPAPITTGGMQGHDCLALKTTNIIELFDELGVPGICMVPVGTDGDGDCLLHSASIGMWGVSYSTNSLAFHNLVRTFVYFALS